MRDWQTALARAEVHPFDPSPGSDYLCVTCGKPRAVHQFDGFQPGNPPSNLCMEWGISYKRLKPRSKKIFGEDCFEKQKALDKKNEIPART